MLNDDTFVVFENGRIFHLVGKKFGKVYYLDGQTIDCIGASKVRIKNLQRNDVLLYQEGDKKEFVVFDDSSETEIKVINCLNNHSWRNIENIFIPNFLEDADDDEEEEYECDNNYCEKCENVKCSENPKYIDCNPEDCSNCVD